MCFGLVSGKETGVGETGAPWRSWGCDVMAAASNFSKACVALAGGCTSRIILFNGVCFGFVRDEKCLLAC